MTTLNPGSLRKAAEAYTEAAGTPARWCNVTMRMVGSLSYNPTAGIEAAITAYLAAEAERGQGMRPRKATKAMQAAAFDALEVSRPGRYANGTAARDAVWTAMWDAGAPA